MAVPCAAASKQNSRASFTTPEKGPRRTQTASTRTSPKAPAFSHAISTRLSATESSCTVRDSCRTSSLMLAERQHVRRHIPRIPFAQALPLRHRRAGKAFANGKEYAPRRRGPAPVRAREIARSPRQPLCPLAVSISPLPMAERAMLEKERAATRPCPSRGDKGFRDFQPSVFARQVPVSIRASRQRKGHQHQPARQ